MGKRDLSYMAKIFFLNMNKKLNRNKTNKNTFGDGTTENELIILSGYSSRIFEINKVPMPDPVPPPSEWVS